MLRRKYVMELPAVYHDAASLGQFDQTAIYITSHGSLFYQNKLHIFMPMADPGVRTGRQEQVGRKSGKQGVIVCNCLGKIGIDHRETRCAVFHVDTSKIEYCYIKMENTE